VTKLIPSCAWQKVVMSNRIKVKFFILTGA